MRAIEHENIVYYTSEVEGRRRKRDRPRMRWRDGVEIHTGDISENGVT